MKYVFCAFSFFSDSNNRNVKLSDTAPEVLLDLCIFKPFFFYCSNHILSVTLSSSSLTLSSVISILLRSQSSEFNLVIVSFSSKFLIGLFIM